MRTILVIATLTLASATVVPRAIAQNQPHHFQLVLERSDSGYVALCEAGCRWKDVSVTCPTDCQVLIDEFGVSRGVAAKQEGTFGFHLQRTSDGWEAHSLAGTAWSSLTWECAPTSCRARVDEFGVSRAL